MSYSRLFTAAALSAVAYAQTQAEYDAMYPIFAEKFQKFGISWEAIPVKTEDGWNLSVFHPTGDENGPWTVTKNAVIFQHGMGGDASEFMSSNSWNKGIPMAFQMGAMGYEVYLPGNRLTTYSETNDFLANDTKEFWSQDQSDYGVKDTPAVVRMIQERNGGKKVAFVGHSQGTTQAFAGMGLIPEWYDQNISTAVMLGPCTSPNRTYFIGYTKENFEWLDQHGVYATGTTYGLDWESNTNLIMTQGPPDLAASLGGLMHLQNVPTKAMAFYGQAGQTQRFSEENPDYFYEENPKLPLIDYGRVKEMKVAMFVGLWDNTCPLVEAQRIYENLGGEKTVSDWIVSPLNGHVPWGFQNNPWFMQKLTSAIDKNADL